MAEIHENGLKGYRYIGSSSIAANLPAPTRDEHTHEHQAHNKYAHRGAHKHGVVLF